MARALRVPASAFEAIGTAVLAGLVAERDADVAQQQAIAEAEEHEEFSGCAAHPTPTEEMAAIRELGFPHFLPHWMFVNRELGPPMRFTSLWEGQERMVEAMHKHRQIAILKAGKLGASELECAFDGYRLRFGEPNIRVHLFSMDALSAKSLLKIVKFGLEHLPGWMALPLMRGEAGGDTASQLSFRAGRDDIRTVISYAPTESAAIDSTAGHSHVDELARMRFPEPTWASVKSTIAPGGTCHIVSRGNGAENYLAKLWEQLKEPTAVMVGIFEPWHSRPRYPESEVMIERVKRNEIDAGAAWYAEQEVAYPTTSQLYYFAPRTAEEALAGAGEDAFIDMARWDACFEPSDPETARAFGRPGYMPRLQPGDEDQVVLSLDAGVTNDIFAAVLVTRHPGLRDVDTGEWIPGSAKSGMAAIRGFKAWVPRDSAGGEVDYDEVDRWVRSLCQGGCTRGHPNALGRLSSGEICSVHDGEVGGHPLRDRARAKEFCEEPALPCPACRDGNRFPRMNVVQITYDRYELHDMMQAIRRDRAATWVDAMDQGGERTEADTDFRTHLIQRTVVHTANPLDANNMLRKHIQGAKAKIPTGDDNRCRIEKRGPSSKVDLAVAASMGVKRCLHLVLRSPQR